MDTGTVAIAIPADPELARAVLARGRRIASRFGLGWIAVRILTSPRERDALRELVDALGGSLVCAEARDVAAAIIEVSRREQSRLLVIGASRRPRFLRRLKRGVTERILQARRPFDVIVAGAPV
jgi:K+-sensing histidine kinase KdpD